MNYRPLVIGACVNADLRKHALLKLLRKGLIARLRASRKPSGYGHIIHQGIKLTPGTTWDILRET